MAPLSPLATPMQGRNEGGKGRNTPGAESLWRICSEKFICFRKISGSNIGGAKLASCPEHHLTSLCPWHPSRLTK